MSKDELVSRIYSKAYARCGYNYYRINPTPITMDNGSVVNVEWVQPSYWGRDVLINYQSDHLFTTRMSENELKQVLEVI